MAITRKSIEELRSIFLKDGKIYSAEVCTLALQGLEAEKLAADRAALLVAAKRLFTDLSLSASYDGLLAAIAAAEAHDATKQEAEVKSA